MDHMRRTSRQEKDWPEEEALPRGGEPSHPWKATTQVRPTLAATRILTTLSPLMRIRLVCFGKIAPKPLGPAVEEYAQRLEKLCKLEIHEIAEAQGPDALKREAELALRKLEGCSVRLALDSRGEAWTSERWGEQLEICRRESPELGLVIGSANGLHADLLGRCRKVSLGPITLPHSMARLVLLEQVYRAHTIVLGLPYHLGH